MDTKRTFTFTEEELKAHDEAVRENTYRKAAIATLGKLHELLKRPVYRALKDLDRYIIYLGKTYNLDKEGK